MQEFVSVAGFNRYLIDISIGGLRISDWHR